MNLPSSLLLAVACYALLTFFLLPSLRVAWKSDKRPQKLLRAGVLAGVEVLSRFSLISALTILAMILVIYGFGLVSPPTVSTTQSFLGVADAILHALSAVKSTWTQILFILCFAISGFAFYRMSKSRLDEAFRTALEKEVDRLRKAKNLGAVAWPFLPPTAEMEQLDRIASLLEASIKSAERSAGTNSFPPDPSIPGKALLAKMKKCQATITNSKGPISDSAWNASCNFDDMPSFVLYPNQSLKNYDARKKDSYQFSDPAETTNRLQNLQSLLLQEGGTSGDCETSTFPLAFNRP
jgi:hypothetical protein